MAIPSGRKFISVTLAKIAATFLFISVSHAKPFLPIQTRDAAEFSSEVRTIVEENWESNPTRESYNQTMNSAECRTLEDYARNILLKLINQSSLSTATRDLYISLNCVSNEREELRVHMRGHTMSIHPSLFVLIKSEDAFAFVLAHELSHHVQRYEEIRAARGLEFLRELSNEKLAEIELIKAEAERTADLTAVRILANADYSYLGGIEVMQYLERAYGLESSSKEVSAYGHEAPGERRLLIASEAKKLGLVATARKPFPASIKAAAERYHTLLVRRPGKPDRRKVF